MQVIKRDGRQVDFSLENIIGAVEKAFNAEGQHVSPLYLRNFAEAVKSEFETLKKDLLTIEEIQQAVEHRLLEEGHYDIYTAYTNYRLNRDIERRKAMDLKHSIERLMAKESAVVNENANKDSRLFSTQRDLMAGSVSKAEGLKMLPKHVANAHLKGEIHWHDLDYSPFLPYTNCSLIDFETLFNHGFQLGSAFITPPKSLETAVALTVQIFAAVAGMQYGGMSFNNIDGVLAPYARANYMKHLEELKAYYKEFSGSETFSKAIEEELIEKAKEKTQEDIYQAMESLEYEINTMQSTQGQTPFTSIILYDNTDWFSREIQKAIFKVRINGLGPDDAKRTAVFPKIIYTLKDGVNLKPEDPNYDIKQLAIECTIKRVYPDIINKDKIIELTGSFKGPMGCRSFLHAFKHPVTGEDEVEGRMNLGVITLNLPRIALESKGDKDLFWKLLDERMAILKDAFSYRIERIKEAKPENAPLVYQGGAWKYKVKNDVFDMFKHKRASMSVGYIGLYEVGTVFYGPDWETLSEAKEFTLDVLRRMKAEIDSWSDVEDVAFSLYGTPSESLTDRFCRLDTEAFGKVPDITDKGYYTNSFHYDVRKNPTPFEKLDFEKDYPVLAYGGFIHYAEYPNIAQNPKALEAVWDYAYDKVGYLGSNVPIDKCFACGYEGEFEPTARGFKCPECGNTDPALCDVVKRTCGYLGNPQARPMVEGRHKEIASRKKHM